MCIYEVLKTCEQNHVNKVSGKVLHSMVGFAFRKMRSKLSPQYFNVLLTL